MAEPLRRLDAPAPVEIHDVPTAPLRRSERRHVVRDLPEVPHGSSLGARVLAALVPWALLAGVALVVAAVYYVALRWADVDKITWVRPNVLYLLLAIAPLAAWTFHFAPRRAAVLRFSRGFDLARARRGLGHHLSPLPRVMRLVSLGLLVFAVARPQRETAAQTEVEGIDIVVALDVSRSMTERDMEPDRLTAAKEVLKSFLLHRKSDRVGLVIFGKEAFTQCPLTTDYRALASLLDDVHIDLIDGRGTAIGNAIGTALNRLRRSDARSKVIILLTDGDNNAGNLSPEEAARLAQKLGVKIFTILMGKDADAPVAAGPFGALLPTGAKYPINPRLLETIANTTGGTPYLATDTPALESRFQAILDELEKSRIKDQRGRNEDLYAWFVLPALALLLVELGLSLTRFRRFP